MRYVVKPAKAERDFDAYAQPIGHPMVYISDPVPTGLVTKEGFPIYRAPEVAGFVKGSR